jgi:pyridinium-3,5-bisthiocarboxylic acid mononucleotide nickel chelatase
MRIAYLDCSSGISGDMFLAALLDAGVSEERLRNELQKIPVGAYEFKISRALRAGLAANRVEIIISGEQPHRHLHHIERTLAESALSETVKEKAIAIFRRLADVEGKLHGKPPTGVHFHEVGAVDAILDIAGTCTGLELLGISELTCSALNVGGGRVQAAHGSLPVPAPATAELLKGLPVYSSGVEGELVTPTGAAIVSTLAASFGAMPAMRIETIGYGAGASDFPGHPNLARLFVGERTELQAEPPAADGDVVSVIQANLDDMNPQIYGYLAERALAAGALDVASSAIQMKKNRPGMELTILCPPQLADALSSLLFSETTTIGLRIYEARRKVLSRETTNVETPYGVARMKVARQQGRVVNAAPEYEDCRRLAEQKAVPLKEVMAAAQAAFRAGKHVVRDS